jgi:hypothetical protein
MPGYVTYLDTVTRHGAPLTVRSYENGRGAQVFVRGECIGSIDNPGFRWGDGALCAAALVAPLTPRCPHWTTRLPSSPASAVRPMHGTPKTTRLRRLDCADGCGYTIRLSRRWMDAGLPSCPCGGLLVPAAIEDADRALERGHLTAAQYELDPRGGRASSPPRGHRARP